MTSTLSPHSLLGIHGQKIIVPDTRVVLSSWPNVTVNKHYRRLLDVVDKFLESFSFESKKLSKLRAADFALFGSLWWPDADFQGLHLATSLIIWLFVWDDELDQPGGDLSDQLQHADEYRWQTMHFVEQSLGICDHRLCPEALSPLIARFDYIGQILQTRYTRVQNQVLFDEISVYIESTRHEQLNRFADASWGLEQYWENRLGTSAVGVTSAVIEFTNHSSLPSRVLKSSAMKALQHETNMIVSIVNDILSAKKEIAVGCYDSYIPHACASGMSAQSAVDEAVAAIRQRTAKFDRAAALLLSQASKRSKPNMHSRLRARRLGTRRSLWVRSSRGYRSNSLSNKQKRSQDHSVQQAVQDFIRTSRQNCVGNMQWSLTTKRYGLQDCKRDSNGAIHIIL